MFNIEEQLKILPDKPGVYIMHDVDDKIIYVGKAVNLKNRVRSYFRKTDKTERINPPKNFRGGQIIKSSRRHWGHIPLYHPHHSLKFGTNRLLWWL